ncbi:vesicle-associated membrane protein 7-like [Vanessa atalanta]|uniref:vesicle-associated membrane protein 7-like n=1 Tax=Vanessa atalanta TaxID=42275 RepID=UPI001FCD1C26|nr:vesicle-associated membrane protein 7-like [Vanessa atalanta]
MSILFSAVAYKKKVFNKYASCDGNFEEILDEVLVKISERNNKMTYYHGRYLFHFILEDEYFYFCITDKLCQRSRAFLFLNEIKRSFPFRQADFTCILAEQMYRYNEDYNTVTIRKGEIDELNTIGVDSSESILGEKILFVSNDNNLRYTTISNIEKEPEQIAISFKDSNLKIIILTIFIIAAISLMFVFNPPSFAFVIVVLILYPIIRKNLYK